jgi:predicted house-cleaning NTP pyrophosphatase (Maf/HAM1 superfamily)
MENERTGEKYYIDSDGNPVIAKPEVIQISNGSDLEILIKARSMKEAKEILTGLSGKYKNLNVDEALSGVVKVKQEIIEQIHITLMLVGKNHYQRY